MKISLSTNNETKTHTFSAPTFRKKIFLILIYSLLGYHAFTGKDVAAETDSYIILRESPALALSHQNSSIALVFIDGTLYENEPTVFHTREKISPFSDETIIKSSQVACVIKAHILNTSERRIAARSSNDTFILGAMLNLTFENGETFSATSNFEFSRSWSFLSEDKILESNAIDTVTFVQDIPMQFDSLQETEAFIASNGCARYGNVIAVEIRGIHGDVFVEGDGGWKPLESILEIASFTP